MDINQRGTCQYLLDFAGQRQRWNGSHQRGSESATNRNRGKGKERSGAFFATGEEKEERLILLKTRQQVEARTQIGSRHSHVKALVWVAGAHCRAQKYQDINFFAVRFHRNDG